MNLVCGYCGHGFEPNLHGNAKNEYCSESCRKRSWDQATRPLCDCGVRISKTAQRCWDCEIERRESNTAHRSAIKELWDQGLPMKEIVRDPRVRRSTVRSLGVEMARMRAAGWELPLRKAGPGSHSGRPPIIKPIYTPQEAARRIGHAVRSGRLIRPAQCERCSREGRVEAHHHDYSKPLDVEWLCRSCHAKHHADERRIHRGPAEAAA